MKKNLTETLNKLTKKDKESLMELFNEYYEDDDEGFMKKGCMLISQYLRADEKGKELINEVLINLCGYSLDTLVDKILNNKEDLTEDVIPAGSTNIPVGTRIKITKSSEEDVVGLTGEITHPFPGLMWPGVSYKAGMRVDNGQWEDKFTSENVNLTDSDEFEVI